MRLYLFILFYLFVWIFGLTLNAGNDTLRCQEMYAEGKAFYKDGNYEKSKKVFEKTIESYVKLLGEENLKVADCYFRLAKNFRRLRYHEKAFEAINKGLSIGVLLPNSDSVVSDLYNEMAHNYDRLYNAEKALHYFQLSLDYFIKAKPEDLYTVGGEYMNMGNVYSGMGMYRKAAEHYDNAYQVFRKTSEPNSTAFNQLYFNMAEMFRKQQDYEKGLDFAEKALVIKLQNYEETHPSVAKYFGVVGENYRLKGDLEKALSYKIKNVELIEIASGKNHPNTAEAYYALGILYSEMKQSAKAIKLYKKSIRILSNRLGVNNVQVAMAYLSLSEEYDEMGDYELALSTINKAMSIYKTNDQLPARYSTDALSVLAELHFKNNKIDEALYVIQDGLKTLVPEFEPEENDLYSNPGINEVYQLIEMLDLLQRKAHYLQVKFQENDVSIQRKNILENALETSALSIKLIEKLRRNHQSDSAREYLNSQTSSIYERAVEQAFLNYEITGEQKYLEKAFEFSDKSKASILWQNLNEKFAFSEANIPKGIADSLLSLTAKISVLEEQGQSAGNNKIANQNLLFDLKHQYEILVSQLEKTNPDYYNLKYSIPSINIASIQQAIPNEQTAVLEYLYTDSVLYIFAISKMGLSGFKQRTDSELNELVLTLRNRDFPSAGKDKEYIQEYISKLVRLHEMLIAPCKEALESVEQLIIIPHGVLNYLPFDMLVEKNEFDTVASNFKQLNYLLKNYSVQYAWSASLWSQRPENGIKTELDFSGFAPGFADSLFRADSIKADSNRINNRSALLPLPNSYYEIESAMEYFDGEIFNRERATEFNFRQIAPNSKIIHLATHGLINDLFPMESGLAFTELGDTIEDGFLSAMEIYGLELNADLAIMSACNTGYGKLAKGEGVMSLGRAFLYAGCKSVIMSLWPANDESTSSIVNNFYKLSDEGLSKDQALRQAKIRYLEAADPLTAHPYFWANLIAVGDMTTLKVVDEKHTSNWIYLWSCFWVLLLGLAFTFAKGRHS